MHEGDLAAAQDLLADIPMYRDSETILNSEIPYIKADGLMAAAESGDSSMLETAGYSAADLKEDTTVSMLLYRSAGEAFEALGDYKDSASRSEECRAGVEREARMLREQAEEELRRQHQETYDHAVSLLDSGAYSEALSVFESLGDFSDSQKMVCTSFLLIMTSAASMPVSPPIRTGPASFRFPPQRHFVSAAALLMN